MEKIGRLRLFSAANPHDALEIAAKNGDKLSHAIWLSGQLGPPPLCGGLALCGRCRLRFLEHAPPPGPEEKEYFPENDLSAGWRLACRHTVDAASAPLIELPEWSLSRSGQPTLKRQLQDAVVGVDLGTTSVEWQAVRENLPVASGKFPNPQAGAGSDVISRLALAAKGDDRPRKLALTALEIITNQLAATGFKPENICVAANSAMTEIILGKNVDGLCAAPYSLSFLGGCRAAAAIGGENFDLIIPPLLSPFAGGDISAGILPCLDLPKPFILADLGTNAELLLINDQNQLFITSVPCGPAMEGIGPKCGQLAGPRTITSFSLAPGGLAASCPAGALRGPCAGISASGYLSLLTILLDLGLMDKEGHWLANSARPMPLTGIMARRLGLDRRARDLALPHGMALAKDDVEMLLKVKAAFNVALCGLARLAGLEFDQIAAIALAGALGEHIKTGDLTALGFLPQELRAKCRVMGNTSLQGALRLAQEPGLLEKLKELAANAKILQPGDDPHFLDDYMSAMRWEFICP